MEKAIAWVTILVIYSLVIVPIIGSSDTPKYSPYARNWKRGIEIHSYIALLIGIVWAFVWALFTVIE